MRIDSLIGAIDSLPLAYDERAAPNPQAQPVAPADAGLLSRLGTEVWRELSRLIVVRRIGPNEPPLLPPSQAYFARENLRLRLLNARASLLARDEAGYREDLRAASAWIGRYFDPQSKRTADALAQLKSLSAASISFEMPSINESLDAVRGYKSRRERSSG
jgi:uroporphyrin-3 C-methyltransferase